MLLVRWECPNSIEDQFEHILKASIEMAAKLPLDEAFITPRGHQMEVDNIIEQAGAPPKEENPSPLNR